MAALTETLSESNLPNIGIRICASADSRHWLVSPVDSVPITIAVGCVIVAMPGFQPVMQFLIGLSDSFNPLISAVITTNIMCGITGSASGGLTIALSALGSQWAQLAQSAGIPLEVLHRIVAVSSIGIDPVPHAGALVTLLAICGLTHKDSYFDIIVCLGLKFLVPFACVVFYLLTGIA